VKTLPKPPRGFRHAPGYPGYAVNRNGQVVSCRLTGRFARVSGFAAGWHELALQWHRSNPVKPGYWFVHLSVPTGKYRQTRVHHLVLFAFVGPRLAGTEARHKNGVSANNNLRNLCWGTNAQNHEDRLKHGAVRIGTRHHNAKLTDLRVRYILTSSESATKLAKRFGVSRQIVDDVRNNVTWKHIKRSRR